MINIGGFGHSGNTALVDFFADSIDICPIGYDYTESAIIRSKWGIKGVFENFIAKDLLINWSLIQDCLTGLKKLEHEPYSPPVHHDFARNARVAGYLGSRYASLVAEYLEKVEYVFLSNRFNIDQVFIETSKFLTQLMLLAVERSGNACSTPLMRNDPAASNIDLLKYSVFSKHYTLVRDPGDMMYDWITYYNHPNNQLGANLFSRQFAKKTDQFLARFEILPLDIKRRVSILRFEDLVMDGNVRKTLYECNRLAAPKYFGRFDPAKSINNIGINVNLDPEAVRVLKDKCLPKFEMFMGRIPAENFIK